ncbi:MAG: TolC family protein [Candidatus Latescibacteria bacterium]|nr:TolC family protein [Candidatus Latescibacterota bacterium]
MLRRCWRAGWCWCFLGAAAWAQEPALSLEELWRLARQRNLELAQQELLRQQAVEELAIQELEKRPVVSAQAGYGYTSEVARLPIELPGIGRPAAGTRNRYETAVVVEQPLYTGGRLGQQSEAALQQLRAQEAQQQAAVEQLLLQVGQLYYQVHLNLIQQQILAEAMERAGLHLLRARARWAASQATPFDTLEVANHRLQLYTQARELADQEQILRLRLGRLLDLDPLPALAVDSPAEQLPFPDSLELLQDAALRRHPELRQLAALREAQSRRLAALESVRRPQVYASAAYRYGRPGVDFFKDDWMGYYTVGLNARWQVWDWGQDQGQVEKARLEGRRLEVQDRQLRLEIRQQVAEISAQLHSAAEQLGLQRQLVDQERERERLVGQSYAQGQATSLDLHRAESDLTAAQLALEHSRIQWRQLCLQLDFATGALAEHIQEEE